MYKGFWHGYHQFHFGTHFQSFISILPTLKPVKITGAKNTFQWKVEEKNLRFDKLREHWDTFKKVANGESQISELPTWNKSQTASEKEPKVKNPFDFDDDIPF